MLDESTGYIRLNRFSKNSDIEVKNALEKLMQENISGLIFDLRDNPGGLLNAAVNILFIYTQRPVISMD